MLRQSDFGGRFRIRPQQERNAGETMKRIVLGTTMVVLGTLAYVMAGIALAMAG